MPEPIVLIGAGKVATRLGMRLHEMGWPVAQVYSRSAEKAGQLAAALDTESTADLLRIKKDARLYLLAVNDDAIATLAPQLHYLGDVFIAHTSGATPATVLQHWFPRAGVFYPLQTFSLSKMPDFSTIPFCIDAPQKEDFQLLEKLGLALGGKTYPIDDHQRAVLHVAAVFVNNFTNHLFQIGEQLLERESMPFELLLPLIRETFSKIETSSPADAQTGPAIRGDHATIERHLAYLASWPDLESIYKIMTQHILNRT